MTTFSIYGHTSTPSAMADPHGNVVVFAAAVCEGVHERMARALVVGAGRLLHAGVRPDERGPSPAGPRSRAPTRGPSRWDAACWTPRAARRDPVAAICAAGEGTLAFRGKITDLHREITGGVPARWRDDRRLRRVAGGRPARSSCRNEFLIFRRDGTTEIVVPDLIVVLDTDDGAPLSTDALRYGQRVAVLALPAHPLLKTPEALDVVGPRGLRLPGRLIGGGCADRRRVRSPPGHRPLSARRRD